jgi:hypothetical protein
MISVRAFALLAVVSFSAASIGCSADASEPVSDESDIKASSDAKAKALKTDLESAARGLSVMSETDSELMYVEAKIEEKDQITPELIVAKLDAEHTRVAPDGYEGLRERFVKTIDLAEYLKDMAESEEDPALAKQWNDLSKLMTTKLTDRVAIRFQTSEPDASDGGTISLFIGGRANGRLVGFFIELAET